MSEQVDRYAGLIAGACSGITKTIVGHPFDTLKVRLQNEGMNGRFTGAFNCLVQTIRKESFLGLYKGATPPLIGWIVMDSVVMGTLTTLRKILQDRHPYTPISSFEHAFCGLFSGLTVSLVSTPIEQLKAKLQVQYESKIYKGPFDCSKQIVKSQGILGLWKGFAACVLFRSFFWVLWGSYDVYTTFFDQYVAKEWVPFVAGGCAANTFWAVAFPADVVKNKIMIQSPIQPPLYNTLRHCFATVYKKEGIRGFYRGFAPCILRSFPTNGAAILCYEFVIKSTRSKP